MAKTKRKRVGGTPPEYQGPPPAVETSLDRQLKEIAAERKRNERVVHDEPSGMDMHFPPIPDSPSAAEKIIVERYGVDWGQFAFDEMFRQPHVQRADKLVQTLRFLEYHLPGCRDASKVYDIGCGDWKYVWGLRHYFPRARIIGVDNKQEPEGFKVDLFKFLRNLDLGDPAVRQQFDDESLDLVEQLQGAPPLNCMVGMPPKTEFNPRSVFKIRPKPGSVDLILDFCFAGQPDVWYGVGFIMKEDGKIRLREEAFQRYNKWLKPGGRLLSVYQVTDTHGQDACRNPDIIERFGFEIEAHEKAINKPLSSWDEVIRARKPL